jgi:signal transduction histidine kinase
MILVTFLWVLTSFFLDTYYQKMRTQEVIRTADAIEAQYLKGTSGFGKYAAETAGINGIYVRVDGLDEAFVFDGTGGIRDPEQFDSDVASINIKLDNSGSGSVTETRHTNSSDSDARLVYASHIGSGRSLAALYIIAPLYPDQFTIRIIKNMLVYITFILMSLACFLAYALSKRITSPIENLTKSATELSQGNYNVRFDGSQFTETKELARALNKASYEMEKTDFYQREILANVSHDLKTPLTMIRSYAEKIIDISGNNPEKRNADLQIIISETERLNRMVSDMLSVSNLQSNNVEMHRETFDLVEAAEDVYESFMVLGSSQGFEIHFHPCKPAYVVGDRSKIMQVMTNFVSNAVKHSGDNKFIDIQLTKTNRKVAFHCIDHGVGIPSDEISHVWDKYYRTSANHERAIEGTGLGLAIAKSILNLHSAKYGVKSEEGKGSDFWFEMDTVRKPSSKGKDNG